MFLQLLRVQDIAKVYLDRTEIFYGPKQKEFYLKSHMKLTPANVLTIYSFLLQLGKHYAKLTTKRELFPE